MSTTQDDTILKEAEKTPEPAPPPKGMAAFDHARASVASSQAAPVKDDTPEPPAEEPVKAADQPTEPAATDTLLDASEIEQLSPKDRKLYEKAQKVFTQKTQAIAAERKAMEQWKPLISGFETNPAETLERVAAQLGLKVIKPEVQAQTSKEIDAALVDLPAEWEGAKPLLRQFGEKLLASIETKIAPVRDATVQIVNQAAAAETDAALETFKTKHADWEQWESKMVELGGRFTPTPGKMTDLEWMETLYKLAIEGRSEAEKTRKVIDRINKSVEAAEAKTSGVSASGVEVVMPAEVRKMDPEQRWEAAQAAAKRGERWSR